MCRYNNNMHILFSTYNTVSKVLVALNKYVMVIIKLKGKHMHYNTIL